MHKNFVTFVKQLYNTDEYISAVISLYLDFINLFLDILRILAATRR